MKEMFFTSEMEREELAQRLSKLIIGNTRMKALKRAKECVRLTFDMNLENDETITLDIDFIFNGGLIQALIGDIKEGGNK